MSFRYCTEQDTFNASCEHYCSECVGFHWNVSDTNSVSPRLQNAWNTSYKINRDVAKAISRENTDWKVKRISQTCDKKSTEENKCTYSFIIVFWKCRTITLSLFHTLVFNLIKNLTQKLYHYTFQRLQHKRYCPIEKNFLLLSLCLVFFYSQILFVK